MSETPRKSCGFTRRDALKFSAIAAGAFVAPGRFAFAAEGKHLPIAVQLYSVRDHMGKDWEGTLEKLAKMGFQGVEFAGYGPYGGKPKELRKLLDGLGLKAAGTHVPAAVIGDEKTTDFHREIGCPLLICPGDGRFTHPTKHEELADHFNKAAEKLKGTGIWGGYHNHAGEFQKKLDGKSFWDVFAEKTSADVVLQQDVGWTVVAGEDPIAYVNKYPGRTKTAHYKAKLPGGTQGKKPFIGQDTIDWKGLITAQETTGGGMWMTLEQEDYPDGKSPLECVEISMKGLMSILKEMGKA